MKLEESFKKITGFFPYEFQLHSMEILSKGKSLILVAPTGSGKTEVTVVPFILSRDDTLPPQMIYSLPTRTLIDNLSKRVEKYAEIKKLTTAFHHGKRKESELFSEDVILTTIDQTVGAYVCTPLSAPIRRGNILAGAVSSAFLVFDEIHTFDPDRGLQTAITLIEHSSRLELPFAVMSATLPDLLIQKIREVSGKVEVVRVNDENEIKSRKDREVVLHTLPLVKNERITSEKILEIYNSSKDKKLIVVCNTVERVQKIYQELKLVKELDAELILIHSRFIDVDRDEKEEKIGKLFGKDSAKEKVILISTQVIEVGLDISAPTMISELAPIDSLIQRAGRCARWGGKGDLYIFDVEDSNPYEKEIVEKTKEELKKLDNTILSWNLERDLVNKILSTYYKKILDNCKRAEIIGILARACFEGDKTKVEECVRDAYTCAVSIHNNPDSLCNENNDILRLQRVNVNVWVFRSKAKEILGKGVKLWCIEENNLLDDYTFKFKPVLIRDESEILPYKHYVVPPEGADYDKDVGLKIGIKGSNIFALFNREIIENMEREMVRRSEEWKDHAIQTLNVFTTQFLPKYGFIIKKFSKAFNMNERELIKKIEIAITLHDLGKLNRAWQEKVGWNKEVPLAHSDKIDINKLPPHATVSARALQPLYSDLEEDLKYSLLCAIAHHHSPRSKVYSKYKFINSWREIIEMLPLDFEVDEIVSEKREGGTLEYGDIPYLGYENNIIPYRFYTFVSKILRLSDWIATRGNEHGILCS